MTTKNGARHFAEFLNNAGVTHVFYIPAIMLKAMGELEKLGIRRVMTHGEKAAAYMADGYARASGRVGVCMSQQIGASNLAAGLRDAFMASSPLLAITGGPTIATQYRHGYQTVEDLPQFDPVTKFNVRVEEVGRMPDLLRQALREATSGTPGPVHIQFRGAHADEIEVDADLDMSIEERFTRTPAFRPLAADADIAAAVRLLTQAERPIIVAGGGVISSGARAEVMELALKLDIPVATSMNAKGTIAENHPLSVGVTGAYSRACANRSVNEADLVFFIGSHTGGQVSVNWKVPAHNVRVIQLDIDQRELGRNYANAASLAGDAKATLAALLARIERPRRNAAWVGRLQQLVAEWRAEMAEFRDSDALPMRPERLCREITDALPDDAVVVCDTGHSGIWSATMIELTQPAQQFIRCAGSMGWGFPGALGVKCAVGDRPVVCFTGDGAFYYHIAELETAARLGINLVVVVNDNAALNQEIPMVQSRIGSKTPPRPEELYQFAPIDFVKVAESFGCVGLRAETPTQVKEALAKAFTMNRPVVIDAITDVKAYAKHPWLPAGASRGH